MPRTLKVSPAKTIVVLAVILTLLTPAAARNNKLAPELQDQTGNNQVEVIVQFNAPPTEADQGRIAKHGGKSNRQLRLVNGLQASLPANQADSLSDNPSVKFISPDRPVAGHLTNTAPAINAPYAWNLGLDGSGIGVAVIDSGMVDKKNSSVKKSDLNKSGTGSSRIVYSQSWVNDGLGVVDGYGHGTHVAGIIGGSGYNSTESSDILTFKGIAPSAQLINLRVLDSNGTGTDSSVIAAIDTAIQLKSRYNIRVINLSLGRPVYESYTLDPLCQAVEAAYRAGIVVVVAAGNEGRDNSAGTNGYSTITSPGNDPYAITVGAMKSMGTPTRADDQIATYSSKGPTAIDHIAKPDLVAPGNRVVSIIENAGSMLATTYPQNAIPMSYYVTGGSSAASPYFALSGTSMAAPAVSGAVALLLQQNSNLTPDQVKARLMKTAYKTFPQYSSYTDPATGVTYTNQYDVFTVGAGYLDVQAALASTDLSTGPAKSPTVQFDPATESVYFVTDAFAVWGGSTNWSSFAVWGGNAFVGNNFAVWGASSPWASFAVWGGSAPWGNNANNGFFAVWGGNTLAAAGASTSDSVSTLINGDS
ncbi:MAG: S8 family peptidase [Acidobacteriia bacterium]|nr:S8 family peptidase [Terriglobia bacterium]